MTFIAFGAVVLGPILTELSWKSWLYALLSLTVVRMIPVTLSMFGSHVRRQTVAFLGWFGPRGLASIVFTVVILDDADLPHSSVLLAAATATVALSIYLHGISASPLINRYVRWRATREQLPMEDVPAAMHRPRWEPH